MQLRKLFPMLVLLPALSVPLVSQADALYTVSALPEHFTGTDINNAGQISGTLYLENTTSHAAIYAGGFVTDLGTFGFAASVGNAINASGAVAGTSFSRSGEAHAFLHSNGTTLDLGAGTNGQGINARGDVVGQKYLGEAGFVAFVYSKGTLTELGRLGTGNVALAYDINDKGKIVGESDVSAEFHAPFHPVLFSHGTLQDLGTIADYEINSATAINNAGRIAGYSEAQDGSFHAFIYEHGVLTDVGGFGGLLFDVGGINEHGAFVGSSSSPGADLGFIYLDGALVDLNTLIDPTQGWHIDGAYGINDVGQIVARGCRDFVCGAVRLDLASAVPEPGGALLLLPGLLTLVGVRRRQVRQPM